MTLFNLPGQASIEHLFKCEKNTIFDIHLSLLNAISCHRDDTPQMGAFWLLFTLANSLEATTVKGKFFEIA